MRDRAADRAWWALAALVVVAAWPVPALASAGRGDGTRRRAADDPALVQGMQWNLAQIGAPAAWPRATGRGVTVAVVDSGIAAGHPDLAGAVTQAVDCIGARGDPARCRPGGTDTNGHGTHVAGIIAARTGNGRGIASVAPDAKLLAVRVLDGCPGCPATGSGLDVAAGLRWAVARGADVVNLSLSTTDPAERGTIEAAVAEAWQRGVIVVAAAGNGSDSTGFAAGDPVLVVTALQRNASLAPYDRPLRASGWAIAAPGGVQGDTAASCRPGPGQRGIVSTFAGATATADDYACLAGTSMAAPHVAGAAALLRSTGMSPPEVVRRLLATARDLGPPGPDPFYGAGALDVARALGAPRPTPVAEPGTPLPGRTRAGASGPPAPASFTGAEPRPWRRIALPVSLLLSASTTAALVIAHRRREERTVLAAVEAAHPWSPSPARSPPS